MKWFPSQKINAIFLLCDFPVKADSLSFPPNLFAHCCSVLQKCDTVFILTKQWIEEDLVMLHNSDNWSTVSVFVSILYRFDTTDMPIKG